MCMDDRLIAGPALIVENTITPSSQQELTLAMLQLHAMMRLVIFRQLLALNS